MHPWPAPHVPQLPGHGQALRLYDSRVGAPLTTGGPARGSVAVSGSAPARGTDLGDVATYVAVDLVVRSWLDAGLAVASVMHLADAGAEPDAEVPVGAGATGEGSDAAEDSHGGADEGFSEFALHMTALGVIPPTAVVGTADAVPEAVEAVERMLASGTAYRVAAGDTAGPGDVYASVEADPSRAASQGPSGDDPLGKRHPLDRLLWRGERPGEPAWDGGSLGRGRPSRHLVCAAEILRHLGGRCDVLAGGAERREDHDDAVVSHLRVLTGVERPIQRPMRTGTVTGGPVRVAELLEQGVPPLAIRLLVLGRQYRRDWEYTRAGLEEAEARLGRWTAAVSGNGAPPVEGMLAEVRAALADDLDTPRALAAVDAWAQASLDVGTPGGLSERALVEGAPGVAARAVDALLGIRL